MAKSEKLPLSPMLVQYLVGICAARWHAGAVDVTLGDLVPDEASETERDVDVTVTVDTDEGLYAFKGYEVKHWGTALSQDDIDALRGKFDDMPSVTHRAIVSSAGYSDAAIKKAKKHDIDLYQFKPWDRPVAEQFPFMSDWKGTPDHHIHGNFILLYWVSASTWAGTDSPEVTFAAEQKLFDNNGKEHPEFPTYKAYADALLLRSCDALAVLKPIKDMAMPLVEALFDKRDAIEPQWHWGHTLDTIGDAVYFKIPDDTILYQIKTFTIYGMLSWKRTPVIYSVLEKVPTGEAFAGTLIGPSSVEGRMSVIIIPANQRSLSLNEVKLEQKHLNSIRDLKIATGEQ